MPSESLSDGICSDNLIYSGLTKTSTVIVDEQKPVRRCLALVKRERFSKMLKEPSESVSYYSGLTKTSTYSGLTKTSTSYSG
ncbi:hypothetical protein [Neisseria meningitidis]|uniref:hypothetical protein n=1 Tax=Neisseria meningitidis TaxID=487 RepID=UPI0009AB4CFC|nr:hypothetical protein [Neisseria meningitidis]